MRVDSEVGDMELSWGEEVDEEISMLVVWLDEMGIRGFDVDTDDDELAFGMVSVITGAFWEKDDDMDSIEVLLVVSFLISGVALEGIDGLDVAVFWLLFFSISGSQDFDEEISILVSSWADNIGKMVSGLSISRISISSSSFSSSIASVLTFNFLLSNFEGFWADISCLSLFILFCIISEYLVLRRPPKVSPNKIKCRARFFTCNGVRPGISGAIVTQEPNPWIA